MPVTVKKMNDREGTATIRVIRDGIGELNVRETLTWTNEIFASGDFPGDSAAWSALTANLYLGNPHSRRVAPVFTDGTLDFGGQSIALIRTASTTATPPDGKGPD